MRQSVTAGTRGSAALRFAVTAVVLLALIWGGVRFVGWFLRSDAARIRESVHDARDALLEKRDEDFLAFFTADVSYQGKGDATRLRRDLARWHEMGLGHVTVVDPTMELDVREDDADVTFDVLVGHGLLELGQVEVTLAIVREDDGEFRVQSFSWRRK